MFGLHLVLDGATLDAHTTDWVTAATNAQYNNASFVIGINAANGFFNVRAGADVSVKPGQHVRCQYAMG